MSTTKAAEPDPRAVVADGALKVRDAAAFSGLSRTELYRHMREGRLVWLNNGKNRLIPRRALVDLMAELLAETQAGGSAG